MLSEPMIAVVGTQHPLFSKTEVSLDDAVGYRWAAPRPTANTTQTAALAVLPKVKLFSDNYPLLIRSALTSNLICVGPMSVFTQELVNGTLSKLPLDLGVEWRSALLTRPEAYLTPLVARVAELFQQAISIK